MKSFLLVVLLFSSCGILSAHEPVSPQTMAPALTPSGLHFATAAQQQAFYRYKAGGHKSTEGYDTLSRLVARRTDTTGLGGPAGTFTRFDTSTLSYTGTRGGCDNYNIFQQKYDADVHQYFSGSTGINNIEYTQTFDANNNILTNTELTWSGSSWQNYAEYTYGYDAAQRLDTVSYYQLSGGILTGVSRNIYHYDASGNLLTETDLTYSGSWVPAQLTTYSYNAMNLTISDWYYSWTGSAWQPFEDDTILYTANGSEAMFVADTVSGTAHYNYYRIVYTYAAGGSPLDSEILSEWNGSTYVNVQKNAYTYPPNEVINEVELWDTTGQYFYASGRVVDLYSPDSTLASETTQYPIFVAQLSWGNTSRDSFIFDADNNEIYYSKETWNGTGWGSPGDVLYLWSYNNYHQYVTENYYVYTTPPGWYPTSNYYWWYETYTAPSGISEVPKDMASTVYPDPFTHTFTVAYDAERAGTATLMLYDITGRLITRTVSPAAPGANTMTWDAGYALPAGVYVYELSLGNAVSRGKIVSQ